MRRLMLVLTAVVLLVIPGAPEGRRAAAGLLEPVSIAGWEVTVRGVTRLSEPLPVSESGERLTPNGRFLLLLVDIENQADASRAPEASAFRLVDPDGRTAANVADQAAAWTFAVQPDRSPFGAAIEPGERVETILLFDVTPESGLFHLEVAGVGLIRIDECHCNLPSPVQTIIPWSQPDPDP